MDHDRGLDQIEGDLRAAGWTTGRTFYRGQKILEFQMPDSADEKFRPMYNLQQQYIEQYLWNAVSANDLIDCRWQRFYRKCPLIGEGIGVPFSWNMYTENSIALSESQRYR